MHLPRHTTAITAALAAALLVAPTAARADEPATPTPMAQSIHAGFLLDTRPPTQPVAVCVIDSGVTVDPDTQAALVGASAWDGSTRVDDVGNVAGGFPHGTTVSSVIAAPQNGWGTIGIWPQAKIVSVRAFETVPGETTPEAYAKAMGACMRSSANVKVINVSLGGPVGYVDESAVVDDQIAVAQARGVTIVASAGNTPGPLSYPARVPGVVAVEAAQWDTGALCSFSATGNASTLVAAGCGTATGGGLPTARPDGSPMWVEGTSFAAPAVAAVIAALRAYRPDLSAQQTVDLVRSTATPLAGGGGMLVNAEAAFTAAGLAGMIPAPAAPSAPSTPAPTDPAGEASPPVAKRPSPPTIRSLRLCRARLTIRVAPVGRAYAVEARAGKQVILADGPTLHLRIPRGVHSVRLRRIELLPKRWSKPITRHLPRPRCAA